jgi:hypothetical protein
MKPIQTNDRLPELLRTWQINPARAADFSTGVWQQIEKRRNRQSWAAFARSHPAALAALILIATIAGGWSGMESARARVEHQSSAMADTYVQGMDARQMTMP